MVKSAGLTEGVNGREVRYELRLSGFLPRQKMIRVKDFVPSEERCNVKYQFGREWRKCRHRGLVRESVGIGRKEQCGNSDLARNGKCVRYFERFFATYRLGTDSLHMQIKKDSKEKINFQMNAVLTANTFGYCDAYSQLGGCKNPPALCPESRFGGEDCEMVEGRGRRFRGGALPGCILNFLVCSALDAFRRRTE